MKRLASNSGLTLIETVMAMVMMIILITGFASIFAFTSVTTYNAGTDAISNAEARSETDFRLSENAVGTTNATVIFTFNRDDPSGGRTTPEIPVIMDKVSVDTDVPYSPKVNYRVFRKP